MKKKILISEAQYKRVFLGEQDPKNKSLAAKASPPKSSFSGALWLDNPLPIDDLFNYHIKNKTDGDNFRKWVRSDSKRLTKVNSEYKKRGLTGTLDSSGSYNNEYMRIAWGVVGQDYLNFKNSKAVDDYAGLDVQHPKFDKGKGGELFWDGSKWVPMQTMPEVVVKPKFDNYIEYINYKEAVENWDRVHSYFGWTDIRVVNSDRISDLLNNKISSSTCINPTYILQKLEELKYDMIMAAQSNGLVGYEQAEKILSRRSFDDYLKNYFGELEIGMKPVKPKEVEDNTYTGGPRKTDIYGPVSNVQVLDPSGGLGTSYYQNLQNIKQFNTLNQQKYEDDLYDYERKLKLKSELDQLGEDFKQNLVYYNKYDKILDIINQHNIIITLQTIERHKNACSNPVYKTVALQVGYAAPGSGGSSPKVDETFEWSQACVNNGGMFMIPVTPLESKNGETRIGFTDNKTICCCVKPEGTAKVTVNGVENDYDVEIDIKEWCGKSIGDIRSNWKKLEDWTIDCASDWHCIADVASIVSIAFGPIGLLVSGLIDLVSAIGYVVEEDEGWKINASLTALGALGGLGEALKLAGKGTKFSTKLGELGKLTNEFSGDLIKLEKEIAEWSKTLNPEELKMFDEFKNLLKKIDDPKYRDLITDLNRQSKYLNSQQKGVLSDIFKNENPSKIKELYQNSGNDLTKMVDTYFKGFKQFIIQGSLFAGLYIYSEDLAKGLQNLYLKYGFDPLGVFKSNGEIDENEILPDYTDILSDEEKLDLLEEKLIESGYINKETYEEETNLLSSFTLKISEILKNNENQYLINSITSLKKEVSYQIDGKRYKHKDIKEVVDLVNPTLDQIINKTITDSEAIKKINVLIVQLKGIEKNNISKEEKTAVISTGNSGLTSEEIKDFQQFLLEVDDNGNNKNESYNKKNMKLNEEIERIKSLFTNERLYGNLVNEVCDNEADAINFLKDKGYIIRAANEGDICLGPNTELGVIYNKYKSDSELSFQSGTSPDGCYLGIYRKNKGAREQHFYLVNLFEKGLNERHRFNLYYMFNDNDSCEKVVTTGGKTFKIMITKEGYDSATGEFGVGLKYVKLEGFWEKDAGDYKLSDSISVKLMDKDNKKIKLSNNISILGVNVPIDLSSLINLDNTTGGTSEIFKDSTGSCVTLSAFLEEKLISPLSGDFLLSDLIDKMKI